MKEASSNRTLDAWAVWSGGGSVKCRSSKLQGNVIMVLNCSEDVLERDGDEPVQSGPLSEGGCSQTKGSAAKEKEFY